MIYVMSDLHGEYDKYLAMLKKIKFSDDDELYILGDVVDRGQKPVKILRDMSMRHNVFPIMGNHDKMAIDVLSWLLDEVNEANLYKNINNESMYRLMVWRMNGAQTTIDGFQQLPQSEREVLLDYMKEFAPYEVVKAGGKFRLRQGVLRRERVHYNGTHSDAHHYPRTRNISQLQQHLHRLRRGFRKRSAGVSLP